MSSSHTHAHRLRGTAVVVAALSLLFTGCAAPGTSSPAASSSAQSGNELLPAAEGQTTYPLTLETAYGESTIAERPARVATVGANAMDAELVLSLGGIPVTAAGLGFDKAPWLIDAADGRIETVFETESWDQYPYEELAAAKPDVIVAFGYDLTDAFDKLSAIAPVVTSEEAWTGYFSNPWQDNIAVLGEALDLSDAAAGVIADYDDRVAEIRAEHPEFDGLSLSYTVWFGTERGLSFQSLPDSIITEVFEQIGFTQADGAGSFSETQTVSPELLGSIDADVLIVAGSDGETSLTADAIPGLTDSAVFQSLGAWQSGQIVITDSASPVGWAMSTAGPLGTMVALDVLVPELTDVIE